MANEVFTETTPDQLVARIAVAFDVDSPPSDGEVIEAMVEGGVPTRQADVAVKLVQIACGRILLDGLGIKFSDQYLCLDSMGQVVESGELSQHPVFAEAVVRMRSAPRALKHLAVTSAEVQTVNTMLKNGSAPADLVTGPSALFVEMPSQAGLAAARLALAEMKRQPSTAATSKAGAGNGAASPAKPWWKIW